MILVVTHTEDYTADFIINKLNARCIPYLRWNCDSAFNNSYSLDHSSIFEPSILGCRHFDSIWFRRTKNPTLDISDLDQYSYLAGEYHSLLNNILSTLTPKKWFSEPIWVYRAENKALQLREAARLGFKLPRTLITNDKSKISHFCTSTEGEVAVKPLGVGRIHSKGGVKTIFTNILRTDHILNLDSFDITPMIFQEYIDKDFELRVTVVEDSVFAAKIDSQQTEETTVDWRKGKSRFEAFNLPTDLSEMCVALVKILNLKFGAIDIIKSTNGEYYFLEINPNGQWAWIEMDTGLDISNSIINALTVFDV